MPNENLFHGRDLHVIGAAMLARRPKDANRQGEARRLGVSYVIQYASPGVLGADATLVSRARAIEVVMGMLLPEGGRVQRDGERAYTLAYSFRYMFHFVALQSRDRSYSDFLRFCIWRLPGISTFFNFLTWALSSGTVEKTIQMLMHWFNARSEEDVRARIRDFGFEVANSVIQGAVDWIEAGLEVMIDTIAATLGDLPRQGSHRLKSALHGRT